VGIRRAAFQLAATDAIKKRFSSALHDVAGAAIAVAFGVALVLLSSQIADEDDVATQATPGPESISLVTLTLNSRGKREFNCPKTTTLTAMRLTSDETAPTVITLPTADCPARKAIFRLEKKPLGKLEEETAIQS